MSDHTTQTEFENELFGTELACQFVHEHRSVPAGMRTCGVAVTHIAVASCKPHGTLLCDAAAAAVALFIQAGKTTKCSWCSEIPRDHWTLRVI